MKRMLNVEVQVIGMRTNNIRRFERARLLRFRNDQNFRKFTIFFENLSIFEKIENGKIEQ